LELKSTSTAHATSAFHLLPSGFCGLQSAVCLLLTALLGCASAPPPKAPEWTTMPPAVLDAFCGKLKQEGLTSMDVPVTIVTTTQPLISGASLQSLGHAYGKDAEVSPLAQLINSALQPMRIDVSAAHSCSWSGIAKMDPDLHHDFMIVELSAPFLNPFSRRESGLFARYSLGGHDSQWYWIPLAEREGIWAIGSVLPLDMHE
jgi:hypothetical protein